MATPTPDGQIIKYYGQKFSVSVVLTYSASTTISAATFSLSVLNGAVLSAYNGVSATVTGSPGQVITVTFDPIDASVGGNVPAGNYIGQFSVQHGSDTDFPTILIIVDANAPVVNLPYNPGTLLGLTAFYAGDTNRANAIFQDAELLACLADQNQNAALAAAAAMRSAAGNAAYVAAITNKGTFGNDESKISAALLAAAAQLVRYAADPPSVVALGSTTQSAPLPVFTTDDTSSPVATGSAIDSTQGGTTDLW